MNLEKEGIVCRVKEREIVDIKKEVKRGLEACGWYGGGGAREESEDQVCTVDDGGMEMVNPFLRIYPRNE